MTMNMVARGLLTFVAPQFLYNKRPVETVSARYCYAVFLRHLVRVHAASGRVPLGRVAEFGPGGSLGTGLAAVIAGAESYFAVDVRRDSQRDSLRVFDELAGLFARRVPIPGTDEFPELQPAVSDTAFPVHLLPDDHMKNALDESRLAAYRRIVQTDALDGGSPITYAAPWYDTSLVPHGTIDWIFSQAVLEHVEDVPLVYRMCRNWLTPGGLMSHQIDFRSHGTAPAWDGHRAYSDLKWRLIRGGRSYLINRAPPSVHLETARTLGFELLGSSVAKKAPTIPRNGLAPQFRSCTEDDSAAAGALFVHRKSEAQ